MNVYGDSGTWYSKSVLHMMARFMGDEQSTKNVLQPMYKGPEGLDPDTTKVHEQAAANMSVALQTNTLVKGSLPE